MLNELDTLLKERSLSILTKWCWNNESPWEHPGHIDAAAFHLSEGNCDGRGCDEDCRDFETLEAMLEYLRART